MALALEIPLPVNALIPDQTSLALLIERAAGGDTAAFERIMIHSQQRVMAVTWRMLGNEADASDASQEVFLRVYKYLKRFRQDQDFFAWLYGITVNVCRDFLKERQHHSNRFVPLSESAEAVALETTAEHTDAESMVDQAQQRELIAKAIALLPFKERASIVLRDMEGCSTEEVAQVMNSSATTVRSQISSARKKIRAYCRQQLRRIGEGKAR
ncbi:MAG TPA: sigma-70 family RNA polymerase sigma factor [Pyrinomonadaceae bacterium]|nr:sigma-70 family RNA polymerase sigma factor [Pyrinomonadaceae bacterium]